jgi:MoaA/NifB/PqqE/SkfB family radical SAM enzyme
VLRRASLVARLAETWLHRPPSPPRAVIDITRRCNLRCSMCRTWEVEPGAPELSATEIGALVASMPRLCWLDLTGGEPLLRNDFGDILDEVATGGEALHVLHFQTNGWFTSRATAAVRRFTARRPEVDLIVTVSIDGPPDLHDRIRGRTGSYRRAIATAAALGDVSGVQVHIGTTVTPPNATSLDALEAALEADLPGFDPQHWHLNVAHTSSHFFANAHLADALATDARSIVDRHRQRRGRPRDLVGLMESVYLINLAAVHRGEPSNIPCDALRSTVFISPEGDVFPCHLWDRRLGNVRETSLPEIWRSAAVARARRGVQTLECGGCFSACEAYPALAAAPPPAPGASRPRQPPPPPGPPPPPNPASAPRRLPVLTD